MIHIEGVLATASVFFQGGSVRLILPRKVMRALSAINFDTRHMHDTNNRSEILEDDCSLDLLFILSDKGIILRPLQDYLADVEMNGS